MDAPPTISELKQAITQLNNGKAAVRCWDEGSLPQDFKDALIVTIYKKKGNKTDCSNYRGITLLSIAGKAIARILLDRLVKHVANDFLPESQCGFRNNRGTSDMVFTLRQIQEKCREKQLDLYITFVDLTKAFDTVNRPALWDLMKRLGCPPKFLQMVIQLHDGQLGRVRIAGTLSKPFEIKNGVKQGCVLAPSLFSILVSAVVKQVFTLTEENYVLFY